MPLWLAIIIIGGTFGGLAIAALAIWLGFKEKQNQLGTTTSELELTVAAQEDRLEAADRRIRNLEAIVTNQVWDLLHESDQPQGAEQKALSAARLHLDAPDESTDAERAEQLAQRLRS